MTSNFAMNVGYLHCNFVLLLSFENQARAKAELREVVTVQDARDVIELVKTSFDDVFKTEEGRLFCLNVNSIVCK